MLSQERRKLEQGRLIASCRNLGSVKKVLAAWINRNRGNHHNGDGTNGDLPNDPEKEIENLDVYREYYILWKWLFQKAKEIQEDIYRMKMTSGGVRMTLEYLRMVHEDEMSDFSPTDFRKKCEVHLDDYLMWQDSSIGRLVYRIEELIEKDRIKRQYHIARKLIEKGMRSGLKEQELSAGNFKMLETWVKTLNLKETMMPATEGFRIEVVGEYDEVEPDEEKPLARTQRPYVVPKTPKVNNAQTLRTGTEATPDIQRQDP